MAWAPESIRPCAGLSSQEQGTSGPERMMPETPAIFIEPFASADREECLRVFDSNTPRFFAPEERAAFAAFLDASPGPFWVVRLEASLRVVGCGGVSIAPDGRTAWLRWGMVANNEHGGGIGRRLLSMRLGWIDERGGVETVRVATTPAASGFFQQLGFARLRVTPNGYGPGLDRHDLILPAGARVGQMDALS